MSIKVESLLAGLDFYGASPPTADEVTTPARRSRIERGRQMNRRRASADGRRRRGGRRWCLIATAWVLAGCNAYVNKFDASPRYICPGQKVDIVWDVTGSAKLEVDPDVAGAPRGAVAAAGHASINPTTSTRVSIKVTRSFGEPTGADTDVHMAVPVRVAADLNDSPSCKDGVLTLKTQTSSFSPNLKATIVGLEEGERRELDVGRVDPTGKLITARVAPRRTTGVFAALSMNGEWTLSAKLGPDESCTNPPHTLTVYAYTSCTGGTP